MITTLSLAGAACALVWTGGYLLGVRRGHAARDALAHSLGEQQVALVQARAQVHALSQQADALNEHAEDLAAMRHALSQAPAPAFDESRLKAAVAEALAPVVAQDQLGTALASIRLGTSRSDLHALLDAIAAEAGLEAVLLSDASGLLLANSGDGARAEIRAGVSALLITVAEHLERTGEPAPMAFVLHDEAQRVAVSRLFTVDGGRFLLTAVSAGRPLSPQALDPVLRHVQRLMGDWTTHDATDLAATG